MSENQTKPNEKEPRQMHVEKAENVVCEPQTFNNYHNSVVINLTLHVTYRHHLQ